MSSLCLGLAFSVIQASIPAETLNLSWLHSVEKIRWIEQYRIDGNQVALIDASVTGSGAGMEAPEGAVFRNGAWHYRPKLPPQAAITLTRSSFTSDYRLCWADKCKSLSEIVGPMRQEGETIQLFVCPEKPAP